MAPTPPRLRILSVGGNAVSAFLSWRLQATNACDVTLVWKSGYEAVFQYGISFRSKLFGNERFKPRHVVRTPDEAAGKGTAFDYVILCVKALPDVYDLASVIESVVTPQHTCILVNTTHTLGVESHLEQRFPTNVVLSLVSGAEITQLGASEFEHIGSTDVWVGAANKNQSIPAKIQMDMAEALSFTLSTGNVDCNVSPNIRQQQFERMIGPISFHPASVLFETSNHTELMEKVGVRQMIVDVMDELIQLAKTQKCSFASDFKEKTIKSMLEPSETLSIMYQDFAAKRPMEVETYLGSPIKIAQEAGIKVPRIESLYAFLHHVNAANLTRPASTIATAPSPTVTNYGQRMSSSAPPPRSMGINGSMGMRGGRASGGMPPPLRRGPSVNGYQPMRPPTQNGYYPRGPPPQRSRRGSFEGEGMEEFSHLVLYDDIPEGVVGDSNGVSAAASELALRERELMIRQRELALREQEYQMRRGRGGPPPSRRGGFDDDDDDDFFDPSSGPPQAMIDPENFDMMSVTSRRTRKAPSASQFRKDPEMMGPSKRPNMPWGGRSGMRPNRSSSRLVQDVPNLHESLMNNPLMGYSSNRYGDVDRKVIGDESRTNSLTAARLDEWQGGGHHSGSYPQQMMRRGSQSPGNPLSPPGRNRPSPPNGGYPPQMMHPGNGRPSPPGGPRQPVPRYPPGQGNMVAPQQVEQQAGVSHHYPSKGPPNVRSLTGSASASAGSGDSGGSANDNSAHSSQSSLGARAPIGVR